MMNNLVVYNKDSNQFELFLYTLVICMMISRKYTETITNNIIRRKINQYTNWNLYSIFFNHILKSNGSPVVGKRNNVRQQTKKKQKNCKKTQKNWENMKGPLPRAIR